MSDTKISARQIANRLATYLATENWVPEGVQLPVVHLDAITQPTLPKERPVVIVSPKGSTNLYHTDQVYQVEVILALDTMSFRSNPAAFETTPEGVVVFGCGDLLDEITDSLVNAIETARPGAILETMQMEYTLDSLPVQYATISLEYKAIATFD